MNKFVKLLVFSTVIAPIAGVTTDVKILKVDNCTSSRTSVLIERCEGSDSKFSVAFEILRPLAKVNMQLNLFKIDSAEFKAIFKSRPIEWCSIVAGKTKANPIIKTFISNKISKLPEAIKTCPMNGRLDVKNVTVSGRAFAILPSATYKLQGRAYDSVDKEIFYFSVLFRIEEDKRS